MQELQKIGTRDPEVRAAALAQSVFLIDKPKGITSFDVIRALRAKTGISKMGHAGTLDPNATGLMLIAMDRGTKLLHELTGLDKTYRATVRLGIRTDTGDTDGQVVETQPLDAAFVAALTPERLQVELQNMVGDISLALPLYSAVKRAGKPLYKYARQDIPVDVPIRVMKVYAFKDVEIFKVGVGGTIDVGVTWSVGSGTYIRSLAEELGRRLGTVATLAELRRLSAGPYTIEQAESL